MLTKNIVTKRQINILESHQVNEIIWNIPHHEGSAQINIELIYIIEYIICLNVN